MEYSMWYGVFTWVLIIGLILSGIGTFGQYWAGNRLESERAVNMQKSQEIISNLKEEINVIKARNISYEQKENLKKKLVPSQKSKIIFYTGFQDGESLDYATQLASVFIESGWQVLPTRRNFLDDIPGHLNIFQINPDYKQLAEYISDSLNQAGIPCKMEKIRDGSISGTLELDTIYIVVGRKK